MTVAARPLRYPVLALTCLMAGCSLQVRSPDHTPPAEVPATWQYMTTAGSAAAQGDWWQVFDDAALDTLVRQALAKNSSLAISALKVQRAQWQAGLTASDQLPSLDAALAGSASRQTDRSDAIRHQYSARLTLAYQLDLWGKLARAHDAAELEAQASAQDWQAARLSLAGTVARLYWQAAYLNERVRLGSGSTAWSEKTLQLVQAQWRAGAAAQADMLAAEQTVARQRAALVALQQQQIENRHAIALLLDRAPENTDLSLPAALPARLPADMAAGTPASTLKQRPDLQAAELRLHKTLAERDVTVASYYPDIALTGNLGASSTSLGQVLANPVATLGSELTLPFLHIEERRLNRLLADNSYRQSAIAFRQSLYAALADVENALAASTHYREQGEQLQRSLMAARRAEQIAAVRYRNGAAPLKDWLDAQEARRQAEIAMAENRYNRFGNRVDIALALGGAQ